MHDNKEQKSATEKKESVTPKQKAQRTRGVVANLPTNCKLLNVRATPSLTANVVCVISLGDGVFINMDKSEGDFYHVKTKIGRVGYCLKKYIKVPE